MKLIYDANDSIKCDGYQRFGVSILPTIDIWPFQYGGRRHVGFSKIRNFNSQTALGPMGINTPNFDTIVKMITDKNQ